MVVLDIKREHTNFDGITVRTVSPGPCYGIDPSMTSVCMLVLIGPPFALPWWTPANLALLKETFCYAIAHSRILS